jgi:hypothetical protein
MIYDFDGSFLGKPGAIAPFDFWTAKNPQCKSMSFDVFICPNRNMAILSFESIAPDFISKALSPIYLREISSNQSFECTFM